MGLALERVINQFWENRDIFRKFFLDRVILTKEP